MSLHVTRKYLKDNFNCIAVGDLQYLLYAENRLYYTSGIYGWNFDGYSLSHKKTGKIYVLTTGYRGTIDNCYNKTSHEIERRYNEEAREIVKNYTDWNKLQEELDVLIQKYLDEILD